MTQAQRNDSASVTLPHTPDFLVLSHYPEAWQRIQMRRAFMQDVLGIELKPEVLPFSNIPAYLPPFWLSSEQAMRLV